MQRILLSLILLIFFIILFPCLNIFSGNNLTEQQALDILVEQIKKDKLYDSWSSLSSLIFITENISEENIDFAIHEKHDGTSSADPYTSPVVDRFRIDRITKEIKWYDVLKIGFVPYANILKIKNTEMH